MPKPYSKFAHIFRRGPLAHQLFPEDMRQDPVIVMGMHCSGTTVLARILTSLGVFMGHLIDPHGEARLFLNLNDWLLSVAHATWDYPLPFRKLLDDDQLVELAAVRLRSEVSGGRFTQAFLGIGRSRDRIPSNSSCWGWKDPRNTICFPLWRRLYPDARFILIFRSGLEVARSLSEREQANCTQPMNTLLRGQNQRFTSLRCRCAHEALSLWQEYNTMYYEQKAALPSRSLLEIRFEDLAKHPREKIASVAEFIGLRPTAERLSEAAALVDPARAGPREHPPELITQFQCMELAVRLGYCIKTSAANESGNL